MAIDGQRSTAVGAHAIEAPSSVDVEAVRPERVAGHATASVGCELGVDRLGQQLADQIGWVPTMPPGGAHRGDPSLAGPVGDRSLGHLEEEGDLAGSQQPAGPVVVPGGEQLGGCRWGVA